MSAPPLPPLRYPPGPEVGSFYHLRGCDLSGRACDGTACFVARQARGEHADPGEPRVYCLGRCFEAPAIGLTDTRPRMEVHARVPVLLERIVRGGAAALSTYQHGGGYSALAKARAGSPEQVLAAVETSLLRGRGGAGFPVGKKWLAAAQATGSPKYVVANADEGDAGAFSDRFLLEEDPHALIEGMAIAAHAVGATHGWIYLRHEYPAAKALLERAIGEARAAGLLGADAGFDVEVCAGHGSYVCGEESAMLRAIEGQRPEVAARPPFPTEHGLFGRPTVTNNVETFACVPWIIRHGADAYAALGFSRSRGTKLVSLNSLFARPGLYEVEFGIPLRKIVEEIGGGLRDGVLKGVLVGGPLAGIIPPSLLDVPFGFEELAAIGATVGHGGIVAFDERTPIAALVHHVFDFGAYESCGKCTPCRLGSRLVERLFASGQMSPRAAKLRALAALLRQTSLCGHGAGLGAFAESVLAHYGEELE